jgi:hypothetical protein
MCRAYPTASVVPAWGRRTLAYVGLSSRDDVVGAGGSRSSCAVIWRAVAVDPALPGGSATLRCGRSVRSSRPAASSMTRASLR